MKFVLLAFLCTCGLRGWAADPIPPELVGEWRNSTDEKAYGAIYLSADGRGAILGTDERRGIAIGSRIRARYDRARQTLFVTTLSTRQEGGPRKLHFTFEPKAKTLMAREHEGGEIGSATHTRRSPKIPAHIKEEFQ